MKIPSCSLPTWARLYEAAVPFKDIECWEWMSESDVFGVQNPENGEIGYCCVLGQLGELFGLVIYLGSKGIEHHRKIHSGKIDASAPQIAYSQSYLSVWFGTRSELDKTDLKVIKELGLNYRGNLAWPQFRSVKAGYLPWYLTESEAQYFALALDQARAVALTLDKDPDWLAAVGKSHYLVRVPVKYEDGWHWESHSLRPAPITTKVPSYRLDEVRLQRLKNTAKGRHGNWELDSFHLPTPVKGEERPYFPYSVLCADHESGLILGTAMAEPCNWQTEFPPCVLDCMESHNFLPSVLLVRKEELHELFDPLASRLGIEVQLTKKLPAADRARKAMVKYFEKKR
jgi:hypothetical protein